MEVVFVKAFDSPMRQLYLNYLGFEPIAHRKNNFISNVTIYLASWLHRFSFRNIMTRNYGISFKIEGFLWSVQT